MPRRNNSQKLTKTVYQTGSTCATKRRFANKLEAERQAEIQMLQQMDLQLEVYKCNSCKGWHLTSTNSLS